MANDADMSPPEPDGTEVPGGAPPASPADATAPSDPTAASVPEAPAVLPPPGDAAEVPVPPKPRGSVRVRRIAVVVLVVLTTIGFTASLLAVWGYRQVLNTSVFADRVETIISDPEVTDALARYVTDEVFTAIDPAGLAAERLPSQAQPLIGPIVAAIRQFVENTTQRVLASEPVQEVLLRAVEGAHRNAVRLIEGEKVAGLQVEGNEVVLNTLPVIQEVLNRIGEEGIFGRTISVPPVTDPEGQPSEQIERIASALGVTLPPDFGQLTVFTSDALSEAQTALKLVRSGLILLLVITLVLFVVTLLLSTNRWRTLAQLGIGLAIAMLLTRFIVRRIDEQILELVKNPDNLPAVRAIDSSFFATLDSLILLVGFVGLVVALLGYVFGRSDSAARLRSSAARQAVRAGASVKGARGPVSSFVVGHPDAARMVAVGVGVLLLLWSGFSMSGIILALVVVAVLLLVVELLVRRAGQALAEEAAVSPAVDPPAPPVA